MTHPNCITVGQRDFHGFWDFPCNLATTWRNSFSPPPPPNNLCFVSFFASLNVSFGLMREAMHRFNGCAKIWSAPGIHSDNQTVIEQVNISRAEKQAKFIYKHYRVISASLPQIGAVLVPDKKRIRVKEQFPSPRGGWSIRFMISKQN